MVALCEALQWWNNLQLAHTIPLSFCLSGRVVKTFQLTENVVFLHSNRRLEDFGQEVIVVGLYHALVGSAQELDCAAIDLHTDIL